MIEFTLPALVDADQLRAEIEAIVGRPVSASREGNRLVFDSIYEIVGFEDRIAETIRAHRPRDLDELEQLVAKARDVWSGNGTFTPAQAQKILAGLVLVVARNLR